MEQIPNMQAATPEIVWAAFMENREQMKETDCRMKELQESQKETDRMMKESRAEFDRERKKSRAEFDKEMKESRADFDRRMKEYEEKREKSNAEFNERMKKIQKTVGGIANNQGEFAEEYFYNSFEKGEKKLLRRKV